MVLYIDPKFNVNYREKLRPVVSFKFKGGLTMFALTIFTIVMTLASALGA